MAALAQTGPALRAQTGSAPASAASKRSSGRLKALVVGLNDLPKGERKTPPRPLNCAENDARAVAAVLQNCYRADVSLLLGPQATRARIRDGLTRQFQGLKAGDTGIFFYAGHGCYVPDDDGDETEDGLDEALLTSDPPTRAGENIVLRDDDIHGFFLERLSRSKAHALLILDCCHSGSLHRGGEGAVRGLGGPVRQARRPWEEEFAASRAVGLFACRGDQSAGESGEYGKFTGSLLPELAIAGGRSRYGDLIGRVKRRMVVQESDIFGQQTPQALGQLDLSVLGEAAGKEPPCAWITEIGGEGRLGCIDRGDADAEWYYAGQSLEVHRWDEGSFRSEKAGMATVVRTESPFRSRIETPSGSLPREGFVKPAGERQEGPTLRVHLHELKSSRHKKGAEAELKKPEWSWVKVVKEGLAADFSLRSDGDDIRVFDLHSQTLLDSHRVHREWQILLNDIRIWKRWNRIQTGGENQGLLIDVKRVGGKEEVLQSEKGEYSLRIGDRISISACLEYLNAGKDPQYLYIFSLSAGYEYGLLDRVPMPIFLTSRMKELVEATVSEPVGTDVLLFFTSHDKDLETIFPSMVSTRSDGTKPVDPGSFFRNMLVFRVTAKK